MNRKITSFVLLAVLFFSYTACDDFLDKDPQQSLDFDAAISNTRDLEVATNGIYSGMQGSTLYGRTILLYGDLRADNVFISVANSNRYLSTYQYSYTPANGDVSGVWTGMYDVIVRANQVISSNIQDPSNQTRINQAKGQAYAVRALAYFDLVRFFAQPYNATADASHTGVPLVLTFEPFDEPSRNTVAEVYTQIVADLEQARQVFGDDKSVDTAKMTYYAATALLARVHLFMENWAQAETYASEVINSGAFGFTAPENYVKSWESGESSEDIFEVVNTDTDNQGTNSLAYFFDQVGYGDALATEDLYNTYNNGDVRKDVIMVGARDDGENPAFIVNKYPNVSNGNNDNYPILRLPEMFLIRAEALAQQNQLSDAMTDLNTICQVRDADEYSTANLSLNYVIDSILAERRKELAFEGHRFFDLLRYKIDIDRPGNCSTGFCSIPYGDNKLIMPIPQAELDANQNISQNTGYE